MSTVGFVGLGAMGSRIAGRLLDAGNELYASNRTESKAQPLIERGLQWRASPREVAEAADVIFSMVTDDAALEAITSGPDGILAGLQEGKLYVDMSTVSPRASRQLAERVDIAGSPILIALNKWDLADTERRLAIADELEDRLGFLAYAPVLRISAKSGLGVHRLLPALRVTIDAYHRRVPTGKLNDVIKQIQAEHAAPGARILYAVQGAIDPPTFTLFATRRLPAPYLRYVERKLREQFGIGPTPVKFRVRIGS